MTRAQLDHALLDVDFFDKPKNVAFAFKFGNGALLGYIKIILMLSRSANGEMEEEAALAALMGCGCKDAAMALDHLIQKQMLNTPQPGIVSQRRVVEDQEKLASKREDWRERDRKRREREQALLTRETKGGTTGIREDLNTEVLDLDLNKKSAPEILALPIQLPDLPPEMHTPGIERALPVFLRKCAKNGRPIDAITFEAMAMSYAGRPDDFEKALLFSASRTKCQNLIEDPGRGPPRKFTPRETNYERNMRILKADYEQE